MLFSTLRSGAWAAKARQPIPKKIEIMIRLSTESNDLLESSFRDHHAIKVRDGEANTISDQTKVDRAVPLVRRRLGEGDCSIHDLRLTPPPSSRSRGTMTWQAASSTPDVSVFFLC